MDNADLVQQLDQIPLGRIYQASQKALVRLHLYATGRTHEMILEFGKQAQAMILERGGKDGVLDGAKGYSLQSELISLWGDTVTEWTKEFQKIRREAAAIPFGVLAVMHDRLVRPAVINEGIASQHMLTTTLNEGVSGGVFDPQLGILLNAASEYLYGDGLNLSGRIWRMDRDARDGMNSLIMNSVSNGTSAWDLAKQVQGFLGANADCPRWTSTRLYGRTKSEIASGDKTGLLSGDACDGSGVSYNALRLARTEIQKLHALATDRMMEMQPWVEKEQVNLSAAHPTDDICDDTVQGGENGEGIYPVGTIELPLHPNCLCYKTAVMMPQEDFTRSLNAWMKGDQAWPEMDAYAQNLGVDLNTDMSNQPVTMALAVWLFSTALESWIK